MGSLFLQTEDYRKEAKRGWLDMSAIGYTEFGMSLLLNWSITVSK